MMAGEYRDGSRTQQEFLASADAARSKCAHGLILASLSMTGAPIIIRLDEARRRSTTARRCALRGRRRYDD